MSDPSSNENDKEHIFSEVEKLQHEIKYLTERVTNLQAFKKNFFIEHHELAEAHEKISLLEEQLSLDKMKQGFILDGDNVTHEIQEHSHELLDYFHDCLTASSYQDLVMSLFTSSENIASDVCLIIDDPEQELVFSENPETREDNINLLKSNLNNGELIHFDNHTILNYKHISLLYTYDSSNDNDTDDQNHQFMEIITLGANSRISNIKQRNQLEKLRKNIYQVFKKTNKSFSAMQDSVDENTIKVSEIYEDARNSITESLKKMNLKDSDQALIKLILDDSRSQLLIQLTSSMSLDQKFLMAMQRLEESYAKEYADS